MALNYYFQTEFVLRILIFFLAFAISACGGGSSSESSSVKSSSSSSISSASSSSLAPATPRSLSDRLEAEDNDGSVFIAMDTPGEASASQVAVATRMGAYIEWYIEVPEDGQYKVGLHHASLPSGNLTISIDGNLVAEIATNTGAVDMWSLSNSTAFSLEKGIHWLRVGFDNIRPRLDWVEVVPRGEPAAVDDLESGLWRLVSRSSRLSLSYLEPLDNFALNSYSGNRRQHWRFTPGLQGTLEIRHEETGQCLRHENDAITLGVCGVIQSSWYVHGLRERSEDRPAIFYVKADTEHCLSLKGAAPDIADCGVDTRVYIEPVGYGERHFPVEYEVKALLIIKRVTEHANSYATISDDAIAAIKTSFEEHVAIWFDRMTDGRVRWVGEVVVSPDPLTSFTVDGGNYLPAAINVQNDVERYISVGQYDTAGVLFHSGQLPGGWGWGPGRSDASKHTLWITVNGGSVAASAWVSWEHEPIEVFIHEPMHGYDSHFDLFGLPLPVGYLHGAELNQYSRESNGYMPWYRDYWLGQIIAGDDTYRGYGPRMFRMLTPSEYALTIQPGL